MKFDLCRHTPCLFLFWGLYFVREVIIFKTIKTKKMKKLLLILFVSLSVTTYSQKFSKVYRASLIAYENDSWVTKQNVYPKSIMVITKGNSIKITNEDESSYMIYGEVEKKSYENFECYSWNAYDKDGKQCDIIIKNFEKEKITVFMIMYYKDSIGFEYEIEQEK